MGRFRGVKSWITFLLLVVVTASALLWLWQTNRSLRDEARNRFIEQYNGQQKLLAVQTARAIEDVFQALKGNLGLLASLLEGQEVTGKSAATVLGTMRRMHQNLSGIMVSDMALFDRDGTVVLSYPESPETVGTNLAWRDYFQWARTEGRRGETYVTNIRRLVAGTMRGRQAMLMVEGIYGAEGAFKGLALIAVDFEEVARRHVLSVHIGQTGYAWLFDRNTRTMLVDPTGRMGREPLTDAFRTHWPRFYDLLTSGGADHPGTGWYEYGGLSAGESTARMRVAYSPARLGNQSWLVGVATPEREVATLFSSFLDRQQMFSVAFATTVFVMGVGACALLLLWNNVLARRVSARTRDLQTAHNRLEETFVALVDAKKLATVGQLATGLAHEIRNPLSSIRLNIQAIHEESRAGEHLAENFEIVEGEILRLDRLLNQLMGYARPSPLRRVTTDLDEVVRKVLQLHERLLADENVEATLDLQGDLTVSCDPEQMQQVLINLLLNAVEATRGADRPGRLEIAAFRDRDRVSIRVTDNGVGVSPSDREQLFEPFFTTRAEGGGLGLAIVQSIVVRHGGGVDVVSDGRHGASFTVHLPGTAGGTPGPEAT